MERPSSTWFVLCCFALFFSLASVTSFVQKSPVIDEPMHLFAGYTYLKWGDFRSNPEHPPLAKMWAALPLLSSDLPDVRQPPHWDFMPYEPLGVSLVDCVYRFFFANGGSEALFFRARLQMIFIGILLGTFIYILAKKLFGLTAAVAALALYALDPNILAHTAIIHTDIPFAASFFIGTYFFSRSLSSFSATNIACSAASFAIAAITKYSAIAILPIWGVAAVAWIFLPAWSENGAAADSRATRLVRAAAVLSIAVVAAYVCIWAVYGFRFNAMANSAEHLDITRVLPPDSVVLRNFSGLILDHHLLPEAWLYGQLLVFNSLQRPTYLLGWISPTGFLSYFPVVFLVKTPIPTLVLIAVAIVLAIRRINRPQLASLMIPALLYFAVAALARINIGVRHLLPIYPFVFVVAGSAAAALWSGARWMRRSAAVLGLWALWACISSYPHYLAYFNELVGGPRNGYRVLLDSNLDWGQDLKGLKRWMDENGVKKIQFAYFGWTDPEYYGIDAAYIGGPWVGYNPPATQTAEPFQYAAVSAQLLYGPDSASWRAADFRSQNPVAVIGHSIFVFKLSENSKIPGNR
jgi:Dolichyl-phosphate-mannose-protein mannosyltransferase